MAPAVRLLFIIDPPQALNPKKDSTIALMRAAARCGGAVYYAEIRDLGWEDNAVWVRAHLLDISQHSQGWMRVVETVRVPLAAEQFDAVLMRKEPPVDEGFMIATRLLDIVNSTLPVFNHPRALRDLNEKLAILNFPELIPPTWTGSNVDIADAFRRQHGKVVLKPLNGMGGKGIYVSDADDLNFRSVFALLSNEGNRQLMAQAYLPAVRAGDFRVFAVASKAMPWMLARIPRTDDYRGNIAAGGKPEACRLDAAARRIVAAAAPLLASYGIVFAGLDVIGGRLIEVNITCPTGLCEIAEQTGEDVASAVLAAIIPT